MARGIFIVTFILAVLNYSLWGVIKDYTGVNVWYVANSICYVGYIYTVYLLTDRFRFWTEIALYTAISSVFDELFFDPTKIQLNEYIGFAIIIFIALNNARERENRKIGK